MKKLYQPFHLVTISPWPLMTSLSLMITLYGWIMYFIKFNLYLMFFGMMMLMLCMFQWWRDVIRESTFQGFHSLKVFKGLKMGMILFIISELMFFFSIFWCYFHLSLSPDIELGGQNWPPNNLLKFNPYFIPLLNTIILLSSGITITYSHMSMINNLKILSFYNLLLTIFLGMIFSFFQYEEYKNCMFSISDSSYGSIFFFSTGFHGLHVIIGSIFLMVNLFRIYKNHYNNMHHFGYEAAIWYWHFVDVIWLFLYLFIYYWFF
nr:cytochrome c oxidase subunit III [Sycophaga agraensis]